jgi:hypothetical protein
LILVITEGIVRLVYATVCTITVVDCTGDGVVAFHPLVSFAATVIIVAVADFNRQV